MAAKAIRDMGADKNGLLSRAEAASSDHEGGTGTPVISFSRADADGDDHLSLDELKQAIGADASVRTLFENAMKTMMGHSAAPSRTMAHLSSNFDSDGHAIRGGASAPDSKQPGLLVEHAGLCWMYLLAATPLLTDMLERGRLPESPREWITEVVVGVVIAVLVRRIRSEHFAVLALARSDALTGLLNRRAFAEALEDECVRTRRSRDALSLVYIDLDNFKLINDRAGHHAGDRVLQQLATAIRHVIRARLDRGFRIGGDEFALLLPGSPARKAEAVLVRIMEHCARLDPVWSGGPLGISAGIVELRSQEAAGDFVRRADDAMYRKKPSWTRP